MKTKLTVTIAQELIPLAKKYARSQRKSLSSLIEAALRSLASGNTPSFARRWRGRFEPADRRDERYDALTKKYL